MASRIISETNKVKKEQKTNEGKKTRQHKGWGSHIRQALEANVNTTEDERVNTDKWLYKDNYDALVANGTLTGHSGNIEGKQQTDDTNKGNKQADTLLNDIEALRMLWVKEDTSWDTAAVFGEHRKKLRAFSEDYRYRKTKLLGHVIRADNSDPMRKVTFAPNTVEEWGFAQRRVGRPKDQWVHESKKAVWKKCRHMEDRQGHIKQHKRTKYKGKPLQDAYIHTWAEERHF